MPKHQSPPSCVTFSTHHLVSKLEKFDVLLGRGATSNHEGNVYLHQLVLERYPVYAASHRRADKHETAKEIVQTVLHRGGRFLQSSTLNNSSSNSNGAANRFHVVLPSADNPWIVVTDQSVLVTKIKQLLRDACKDKEKRIIGQGKKNAASKKLPPPAVISSGSLPIVSETIREQPQAAVAAAALSNLREEVPLETKSTSANNQEQDLLVYLALVGHIPKSNNHQGLATSPLRMFVEMQQQQRAQEQQRKVEEELVAQAILSQVLAEQNQGFVQSFAPAAPLLSLQEIEALIQLEQLKQHRLTQASNYNNNNNNNNLSYLNMSNPINSNRFLSPSMSVSGASSSGFPQMDTNHNVYTASDLVVAQVLHQARMAQIDKMLQP